MPAIVVRNVSAETHRLESCRSGSECQHGREELWCPQAVFRREWRVQDEDPVSGCYLRVLDGSLYGARRRQLRAK